MAPYKHPCRFCGKLMPPDSNLCPFCGRKNPEAALCPICRAPIQKGWKVCSCCGLSLEMLCPKCGKSTFLDGQCEHCGADLTVVCKNPRCKTEQPISSGKKCVKCGKTLK